MQITSDSLETATGPGDWFTGTVYIDAVATPSEPSRLAASSVHFAPGARTAWHTHPNGQTIYVTEGRGLCQCAGHLSATALRVGTATSAPVETRHPPFERGDHTLAKVLGSAQSLLLGGLKLEGGLDTLEQP